MIGVEIVELEVYSLNIRAVHVYERVDYKITGCLSNSTGVRDNTWIPF
jgi:hypothetical protein